MTAGKHWKLTIEDQRNMVDQLRFEVCKGWHYFHIFYMLDRVYYPVQHPKNVFFFSGAASACKYSTLLVIARLLDPQEKLSLKGFRRELGLMLPALAPDLQTAITNDLDQLIMLLGESSSIEAQIRRLRNNQIAHLSMDYIRDPGAFVSDPPVNMAEVRRFFHDTLDLLNSIAQHLGMDAVSLEEISDATIRDTQSVLDRL